MGICLVSKKVTAWLEQLGLGQYAIAFEENELDLDQLIDLSNEDLKDLGVAIMGHRKKLFRAIDTLRDMPAQEAIQGEAAAQPDPLTSTSSGEAERRQLTVMFCDLVGSTELSRQFDPEDLQTIIAAYQAACNAAIERFDGYVARYMGDGMLVYFGYPVAHEDDAERAVRAGLGIIEEVALLDLNLDVELAVRVGIATGLVVAGDIIGDGASEEHSVLGETPNLAARLQGVASPGNVIIAETTRRLVEGRIQVEALEPLFVKGFSDSIQAFRATEVHAATRFDAATSENMSPFVARQSELNLLTDRWQQACSGDGQVVLLSGEAGIGKSRILHELRDTLSSTAHTSVRYQCSPFNANTPFYPIIEQLGNAAGFSKNDTNEDRLDKLERLIAETSGTVDTDAPLLAALMSLPIDRYPHLELSPQQQKMETITLLVEHLVRLSTDSPVIVIVEDIHWIDPSTLEVFDAFVDSFQKLPVLLIMTHRPGIEKRWEGFGHITQISLNRLGQQEMRALVGRISGGSALPESVLEQVLQRTDGVPLFVEELIKTLLESELAQETAGQITSAGNPPPMLIPATLRDSLMARLDRLAQVKEVAQAAACIGREFSYELLSSIVDTDNLSGKLDLLVDSGLVFRRRSGEQDRFVFKHALVQDAAYESLLKSRRKDLHGRIAEALEQEFADKTGTVLELLAHHYSEAGLIEPALQYWLKAGQQSAKLCAHAEAIAHLRRGLSIVDTLPEGEDKARHEIEFRVDLGVPLQNKEGAASQAVYENYLRAQKLCEQLGENERLYPILWGLWFHHYINSKLRKASEMADRLLEVGQNRKDTELVLEAHHCQWAGQFISGDLSNALEHCNHGVQLYRADEHHALTFTYGGHDPGACARYVSGAVLWLLGYPVQSQERYDSAFSLARELDHSTTLSTSLAIFLQTCIWRRDENLIEETAGELLELAENAVMPDIESIARGVIGWVRYQRGDRQEGLQLMREEVDRWLKLGIAWAAAPISLYAETLAEMGDVDEALKLLDHSINRGQSDDVRWCEAQLYCIRGNLLLINSTETQSGAEEMYRRAIEVAREQNAKSVELRASMSLALLWQSMGKSDQALELLQPVYDWFTEGLDTKDLIQANELLLQLK
jgi:class 3 adenylate cyclase/tetratricopeptide (TPR) repeat protein